MKLYWEIIADNLTKPVGVRVASHQLILRDERSGSLTHMATTESAASFAQINCHERLRVTRVAQGQWQHFHFGIARENPHVSGLMSETMSNFLAD